LSEIFAFASSPNNSDSNQDDNDMRVILTLLCS